MDNEGAQHSLARRGPSFPLVVRNVFIQHYPRCIGKNAKSAAGHGDGTKCTRVAEAEGGGKSVVVEVEEGGHDEAG